MRLAADIYRAMAARGLGPPTVDEMELWQIAAVLGLDLEDTREGMRAQLEEEGSTVAARAAAIRQMRHSDRTGSVEDSGEPVDITGEVMRQMGIRR